MDGLFIILIIVAIIPMSLVLSEIIQMHQRNNISKIRKFNASVFNEKLLYYIITNKYGNIIDLEILFRLNRKKFSLDCIYFENGIVADFNHIDGTWKITKYGIKFCKKKHVKPNKLFYLPSTIKRKNHIS